MAMHRADASIPERPRAAYRRPVLKVYGEIATVTLSNDSNTKNDKGNGSSTMT